MQAVTRWKNGLSFEGEANEHIVNVDTTTAGGGGNTGMNPKHMLLCSLGACSGMDVVSVLAKMKVHYTTLEIIAEAEQTDEHPKVFKEIFMTYKIDATKADADKVKRAVELSQDKYCGISAMLKKHCAIHHSIIHI